MKAKPFALVARIMVVKFVTRGTRDRLISDGAVKEFVDAAEMKNFFLSTLH